MKNIVLCTLVLCALNLSAQVGIGTATPDNSAMLDVTAANKGILFPRLTTAQRIAISTPATGLHVFDTNTYSLWFFNGQVWVNTAGMSLPGDVKSGMQQVDHAGWIKMDGRAVNTLTSTQQAQAILLGYVSNIPNAANAYLVSNGSATGTVSGSNTTTLVQANLPNVNFTGDAASAGAHTHNVDPAGFWSNEGGTHSHASNATGGPTGYGLVYANGHSTLGNADYTWGEPNGHTTPGALSIYNAGNHSHVIDVPNTTSTSNGAHTHTVSVSSGGSATPINIAPRSLTVNMFIYLGY